MSSEFAIGDRRIGPDAPTFIIAEAGSNHDGDSKQAKELIDIATDAGADAVKFQVFKADELAPAPGEAQDTLRDVELPRDWLPDLADHARDQGLTFLASPFDAGAIDALVDLDCPALKIASSEVVNLSLLRHAATQGVPLIVSTAMSDLADITEAVTTIRGSGDPPLALLQCTAVYPLDPKDVHLRAMDTLRQAFDVPVGFSDHTIGTWAPVAAVARGACIIEKHFTLDRNLDGPDHGYALEPKELGRMVQDIRRTEDALGTGTKQMLPEEAGTARRDGLIAARTLSRDGVLGSADLDSEWPPGQAIPARFRALVVGQQLSTSKEAGDPIFWHDLKQADPKASDRDKEDLGEEGSS